MTDVVARIDDMDVRVKTVASISADSFSDGSAILYVGSRYDDDFSIASFKHQRNSRYALFGKPDGLLFLSLILNSFVGAMQLKTVNIKAIRSIVLPNSIEEVIKSGMSLELICLWIQELDNAGYTSFSDGVDIMVVKALFRLLKNYYVQQMYLPDFFMRHQINIVSAWEAYSKDVDFVGRNDLDLREKHDIISELFEELISDNVNLLPAMNKMKVYHLEVMQSLRVMLQSV